MDETTPSEKPERSALLEQIKRVASARVDLLDEHGFYQPLHAAWSALLELTFGDQRAIRSRADTSVTREDAKPTWRSRFFANHVVGKVNRAATKLAGEGTVGRASPATPDYDDVAKARNSEALMSYMRLAAGFEEERTLAVLWAVALGTSAVRLWFDFDAGPRRRKAGADGKPTGWERMGEVRTRAVSPFSLRLPVAYDREDDLPWVAVTTFRDPDWCRMQWPHAADRIVGVDPTNSTDYLSEMKLRQQLPQGGQAFFPDQSKVVRVTELWVRPTFGLKHGAHGIFCNAEPVHASTSADGSQLGNPGVDFELPIPVVLYRFLPKLGSIWGLGLPELLETVQSEYNRSRADVIESVRMFGRPKLLSPRGALVNRNSWTSAPGEIVEYNMSAGKPEPAQPPAMPPYVLDNLGQTLADMAEISGQQEASEGKAPASIRSGVAIQLLQQAANESTGIARIRLMMSDRSSYRGMLRLAGRFYDEARAVAILGADKRFEVLAIAGSDLGDPESVVVYPETGLFESKAARRQNILDALQLGAFDVKDPFERIGLVNALEMGDIAPELNLMLADRRAAEEENHLMASLGRAGEMPVMPQARDFEDHVVHIRIHNGMRKSAVYRGLTSEAQAAIDQHVAMHQRFLAQQMAAMSQQDAGQRGKPAEKGKPSPENSGKSGQAAAGPERSGDDE